MSAYFDTSVGACLDMLPPAIADRSDLTALAAECEADVIAHYRRRVPEEAFKAGVHREIVTGFENLVAVEDTDAVHLRYYEEDADDLDLTDDAEVRFLSAMRRTVAMVIRHRASVWDREMGVASESRGRRSVTYRKGADSGFPDRWTRHLKAFDLRPPTFVI